MSYEKLAAHYRRIHHLDHALAMLHWDEAVMMPEGGGARRAEAIAGLYGMQHELATRPELGEWIAAARAADGDLSAWQRANLGEIERSFTRSTCVPPDLVEALALATRRCEQAWRKLRPQNDWNAFRPLLEEVVRLTREHAAALSGTLGLDRYDALLDGYEPGARADAIGELFDELRDFLPGFTRRVLDGQSPAARPSGPFDREAQRRLGQRLMRAVGFDPAHGRLDVSHHPFCGGVPGDVRITTRYDDDDFSQALMGVLHETGHAKYEQGLPVEWADQPVGAARSMGIHESQSLLQEMQIARSREFLAYAAPIVTEELGIADDARDVFTPEALYRFFTRVEPGKIRVDADEVTYPLHVILRFEIERPLIEGRVEVADIPELWERGMRELLDVDVAGDHTNGCMQDVHWSAGLFGYFPTYTLGALTAAQVFAAARRDLPQTQERISRGDFAELNAWLRERIWSQASLRSTDELLRHATGAPLDAGHFRRHLEARYLG